MAMRLPLSVCFAPLLLVYLSRRRHSHVDECKCSLPLCLWNCWSSNPSAHCVNKQQMTATCHWSLSPVMQQCPGLAAQHLLESKPVQEGSILGKLPQLSRCCFRAVHIFVSDRSCRGYFLIFIFLPPVRFQLFLDFLFFSWPLKHQNARCAQTRHLCAAHVDAVFAQPSRRPTSLLDVERTSPCCFTHNPAGQNAIFVKVVLREGSYRMALPQPHGHVCPQITTHLPFVD